MRGLFSMVGLLVVLAILGLVAKQQLSAKGTHKSVLSASSPVSDALNGVALPLTSARQSQPLPKQVQDDVNQLMQNRTSDLEQQAEPKP